MRTSAVTGRRTRVDTWIRADRVDHTHPAYTPQLVRRTVDCIVLRFLHLLCSGGILCIVFGWRTRRMFHTLS
jgi:hypothetical protein